MTDQNIKTHKFDNGMTLVLESMPDVSSAAFVFVLSAGAARDPHNCSGAGAVLSELLFRGTADMDNRTLNDKLDSLGLQRSSSVGRIHCNLAGALVGNNLLSALKLYANIIRRPTLAPDQFSLCQTLALQNLDSLDDDPRQRISLLAYENYLPHPFGRPPCGRRDELGALTPELLSRHWKDSFTPDGAILAVAGAADFNQVKAAVARLFADWKGDRPGQIDPAPIKTGMFHHPHDGAQVHISVMYPTVTYLDDAYYPALAAAAVLSGGMGSRLFTELREKRGLCYAVMAAQQVIGTFGLVHGYVGSSPDQAQEALDLMLSEFKKLAQGITLDELDRAKVGLRASLIMQGEASTARAAAAARDMYYLGRVRTLAEIEAAINAITVDDVVAFAQRYQPHDFCITTLGPKELTAK